MTHVEIIWQGFYNSHHKNLQEAIMNMFETNAKMESLSKEIKFLSKEIKATKKNQTEILEIKKHNSWNIKISGWAQQQNGLDRGKNPWTCR